MIMNNDNEIIMIMKQVHNQKIPICKRLSLVKYWDLNITEISI
jgi:hypothetical protein